MNQIRGIAILVLLGLGIYLAMSSVYVVSEVEQMIITQFGKPVGDPVTTAGLKVKVPFIQDVNPIDKRVLEWDGNPSDMPTKDKLYISVDLFATSQVCFDVGIVFNFSKERTIRLPRARRINSAGVEARHQGSRC